MVLNIVVVMLLVMNNILAWRRMVVVLRSSPFHRRKGLEQRRGALVNTPRVPRLLRYKMR